MKADRRDHGTPELVAKRQRLVGHSADPALAATIPGILFARGFLDRAEYDAAQKFARAAIAIVGAPFPKSLTMGQMLGIDPAEDRAPPDEETAEIIERRNLTVFRRTLNEIERDSRLGASLIWNAYVLDNPPPFLTVAVDRDISATVANGGYVLAIYTMTDYFPFRRAAALCADLLGTRTNRGRLDQIRARNRSKSQFTPCEK